MPKDKGFSEKFLITVDWWREDGKTFYLHHREALTEHAQQRINQLTADGYLAGELLMEVNGAQYRGWWNKERVD